MLRLQDIMYRLPDRPLLNGISFEVQTGERWGLVGRNGSGKTTLLRIIVGELAPDAGQVFRQPASLRIGYLAQGSIALPHATAAAALGSVAAGWSVATGTDPASGLANAAESVTFPNQAAAATDSIAVSDPVAERRIRQVLGRLALSFVQPTTRLDELSGGQRTRLSVARILLDEPDLLVLDEPTNHLDLTSLAWFEQFLGRYPGAVLLVSHDRSFLDRVATGIIALENGLARTYAGGYSSYREAQAHEEALQWSAYRRQERERDRIEEQLRQQAERARHTEKATVDFAPRARAKKAARQVKVQERRLERRLVAADHATRPERAWDLKLDFGHVQRGSRTALSIADLTFGYGQHRVLRAINLVVRAGEHVVIGGENGSGKSTLVRLIAGQTPPQTGTIQLGESTVPAILDQDQRNLPLNGTPVDLVRAVAPLDEERARSYLHFFLFVGDQVWTPIGKLSYGERARLSLAAGLLGGANLLLLDEPLNHLDIPARERLERALQTFPGTSIIVAHDLTFARNVATRMFWLHMGTLLECRDADDFAARAAAGTRYR